MTTGELEEEEEEEEDKEEGFVGSGTMKMAGVDDDGVGSCRRLESDGHGWLHAWCF